MSTFIKAQFSSLTSTAADFAVTVLLKELMGIWYLAATALGTITGGITNFLLGRKWVFVATNHEQGVSNQFTKYVLVWAGNLALNTGGVFACTNFLFFPYIISKAAVSVVIGCTYNYTLQKKFVFRN